MVISKNSQLGLRFKDEEVKIDFLQLMKSYIEDEIGLTESVIDKLLSIANSRCSSDRPMTTDDLTEEDKNIVFGTDLLPNCIDRDKLRNKITTSIGEIDMLSDNDSSYYFICESVFECAKLIKIQQWFSGRTLKDISFGKYTYLLGKNTMVRFLVGRGAIKGWFYDCEKRIVFEWGIEMDNGEYYFSHGKSEEFTMIMRILTFVELGDIEILELKSGRNNHGKKGVDKVTNTSNKTVYVVDSTWNKIILRTDGFAVMGHFRLQPCGAGLNDRKLIWINAFEKHGYKRRPKAEIRN